VLSTNRETEKILQENKERFLKITQYKKNEKIPQHNMRILEDPKAKLERTKHNKIK
jgi:hypothetical protein